MLDAKPPWYDSVFSIAPPSSSPPCSVSSAQASPLETPMSCPSILEEEEEIVDGYPFNPSIPDDDYAQLMRALHSSEARRPVASRARSSTLLSRLVPASYSLRPGSFAARTGSWRSSLRFKVQRCSSGEQDMETAQSGEGEREPHGIPSCNDDSAAR